MAGSSPPSSVPWTHRVAEGPGAADGEADTVLRHGVFPVHHTAGRHLRLVVPARGPGPPPAPQPAGGRGSHCPHHRPLHHLCPLDAGLLPLPLPAVLRVEKDQPESSPEDPGGGQPRGPPAFSTGSWTPEEGGRGDTSMNAGLSGPCSREARGSW
eukprot:XP_016882343.1 E3 ubiquitin-protein ligase MARCH2 isoform X4 [Homo sapiens]